MQGDLSPERPAAGGVSRKTVLRAAVAAAPAAALLGAAPAPARDRAVTGRPLTPTPSCDDGDDPTPPQTEGPYFTPGSPERRSLHEPGQGTRLTVSGYVFGPACRPVPDVLLDFWQADGSGAYDNMGYRFRGHQYTDASGAFRLVTNVPGLYPGRTRHLHVKVQAPHRPVLTTQLYFPGEPRNHTDALFDPALLMTMRDGTDGREGTFDVVLDLPQDPGDPGDPGGTWSAGTLYQAGDRVTYGGATYACLQAHRAAPGWEPPNVPALWRRM
ncbi:carbohydrate-binding protein [Streptomyces sp. JJ36]|uniref:carbohydrate-binding protein n=1 Tax=Streptomyces sp. JJ36 TaxID=2736645 RepID=UPI001F22A0BA|nr:carbohydrate-binding protein [Streptomyces sp. JJ36]MCF6525951.1 dioxygenase [Streptomyces sp. JJ36]